MMRFSEFTTEVVNKIKEFLPESFANASVELQTVTKNNDLKLTGLSIRCADNNICPTIYLEHFYDKYEDGEEMSDILSDIADLRVRNEMKEGFDVEQITNFERVKESIVPRLVGTEWNASLLEQRPHKLIADLAITYHVMIKQDLDGTASAPITYQLMNGWGIDEDTLYEIAMNNLAMLGQSSFRSITSVLREMMPIDIDLDEADLLAEEMFPSDEFMYVLSNEQKLYGATALLDKEIMKVVVDKFGTDFYILPSSVHEVIIIKANSDMNPAQLSEMIESVNFGQVAPDERLGSHPYQYTLESGLIAV